jgi:2-polyprenyl-3-methyl-5-hydroxy-6-metoxy-1,4-benzoquinol methylase
MDDQAKRLNEEGRALWDEKAAFWDQLHGEEGNRFHRELIAPALERLLTLSTGERVLDIACGSGVVARRLAALGAHVTATDFSPALIERARARGQAHGQPIDYRVVDATDEEALAALGEGVFDAITCTMALMDMPAIAPFYRAVRRLLRPAGRAVIATAHPAFNSLNPVFYAEVEDRDGQLIQRRGLKIEAYLDIPPVRAAGAPNEPNAHYYYHRPMSVLLGEAFAAGLVIDAVEEPTFGDNPESSRLLSWYSMPQIPPVLLFRLRLPLSRR